MAASHWWQQAVVYQIYPRSFCDTNGDGVGDLEGIRRHLDHLVWLGVDAIWISPFFRSPMKDYGYDVSDYCAVDPLFGTLEDFDRLLAEAHQRGLRVLIDWVPNHSSDQHAWFREARISRDSAKRDWYVWRDGDSQGREGSHPNNWTAAFTNGPAWTWDEATSQWYLHLFLSEQPDLNWANPEVEAAMHDILRFWLARGVDGFRMDVIHCIGKDPALPDAPEGLAKIPYCAQNDEESTHDLLRRIRSVLEEFDGDRVMVGEVYLLDTARVARYYGNTGKADELHLSFNFPPLYAAWEADAWRGQIDRAVAEHDPIEAWPSWVLSNHDNKRHRTRYGSEARARAAAVLLLSLRGTPFLYAGEELGLEDAEIPEDRVVDPGGRDGCRAPIPWEPGPGHGWGVDDPWLPWPPDADDRSVARQREAPDSMLDFYRRLLGERRKAPSLQRGSFEWLAAPDDVLAWRRAAGDDVRVVVVNFADRVARVELPGPLEVRVSTVAENEGASWSGELSANQALVLAEIP
jgi:alpha-glucosidase